MKKGIVQTILGLVATVAGGFFAVLIGTEAYRMATGSLVFTNAEGVVEGPGKSVAIAAVAAVIAIAGIILAIGGIKKLKNK